MNRFSEARIRDDLGHKIVLLSGPRQAGKRTLSKQVGLRFDYVNFDSSDDRKRLRSKAWDREARSRDPLEVAVNTTASRH